MAGINNMIVDIAITAVSTAFVGRQRNEAAMVRESMAFHGKALAELRKALVKERTKAEDETILAALALRLYEVSS